MIVSALKNSSRRIKPISKLVISQHFTTSNLNLINYNNLNKSDRKPYSPPPITSNNNNRSRIQLGNSDSYQLTEKVKQFASNNQLDLASDLVKNAIKSNIVVWNVLINEFLYVGKYKASYDLWMDMKRRGLIPTSRSYSTFFSGYSKIKDIEDASLGRVKTIFAQWSLYAEKRIEEDRTNRSIRTEPGVEIDEITCVPTNAYLTFLGNTKKYELLLEVFEAMPNSGPLAADSMTYSIILSALRNSEDPNHFPIVMNLWKKMSSNLMAIDTKTVSIVISFCRDAQRPDDQRLGLEVAKEFYGLVDPAAEDLLVSTKLARPRVMMDSAALSNVLSLCLATQQYNLAVRWFDQVRDYPKRFGRSVLEHYHCNLTLIALAAKKDAVAAEDLINWMRRSTRSLHPTLASYTCAFQVYWKAADLNRALKLVTLMSSPATPLASVDPPKPISLLPVLRNPSASTPNPLTSQPPIFKPDSRIASTLLQTSLATRDRGDIYRTIEVLESYGFGKDFYDESKGGTKVIPMDPYRTSKYDNLLSSFTKKVSPPSSPPTSEPVEFDPHATHTPSVNPSHVAFWKYKLSEVLERALERVLQGGENHLEKDRRRELAIWRGDVVSWLDKEESIGKVVRSKESLSGPGEGELGEVVGNLGVREESMRGRREIVKEKEMKRQLKFINEKKRQDQEAEESNRELYRSDAVQERRRSPRESNNNFGASRSNRHFEEAEERRDYGSRSRILDPKEQFRLREAKVESWPTASTSSPSSSPSREGFSSSSSSSYPPRPSYGDRNSRYDSSSSSSSASRPSYGDRDRPSRGNDFRSDRPSNNYGSSSSSGAGRSYGNNNGGDRGGRGDRGSGGYGRPKSDGYGQRREQYPKKGFGGGEDRNSSRSSRY